MNITATIDSIGETITFDSGFTKREFVVKYATNPQYPQFVKVEVVKDMCNALNAYQVGQDVDIYLDIQGRKWTGADGVEKVFNTLRVWKINPVMPAQNNTPAMPPQQNTPPPAPQPQLPGAPPQPQQSAVDGIPF
jgi:hypothetical protein